MAYGGAGGATVAAGGGGAGGAAAIIAPYAVPILVTTGASVDLVRYVRTGNNGGPFSITYWGDQLGFAVGSWLYPNNGYGADAAFMARWRAARMRAADGCSGSATRSRQPDFWGSFQKWIKRIAKRGGPAKNSKLYEGPCHVYAITGPDGLHKIGYHGGAVTSGGYSARAAKQVADLNQNKGGGYSYRVLRGYANSEDAFAYETALIQRFTSRYGRRPPGNPVDR
jgi:hypothetical protein